MVAFVGVPAEFTVFTKEAGDGDVDVRVIDNDGKQVHVDVKDNKDGTYTVIYYPTTVGAYTVNITFNTESIPKSPFKVNVCQTNSSACRAYGPGLEKVRAVKVRTGSGFFAFLGSGLAQIFRQIVSIIVKTLSNKNVIALRQIKGEKFSFPVQKSC